jgi:hypothetical protein
MLDLSALEASYKTRNDGDGNGCTDGCDGCGGTRERSVVGGDDDDTRWDTHCVGGGGTIE